MSVTDDDEAGAGTVSGRCACRDDEYPREKPRIQLGEDAAGSRTSGYPRHRQLASICPGCDRSGHSCQLTVTVRARRMQMTPQHSDDPGRDVVVIGASAGGDRSPPTACWGAVSRPTGRGIRSRRPVPVQPWVSAPHPQPGWPAPRGAGPEWGPDSAGAHRRGTPRSASHTG